MTLRYRYGDTSRRVARKNLTNLTNLTIAPTNPEPRA